MVKCPECGKELDSDEVLVPVFDKTDRKLIACFHVKRETFEHFRELAEKTGITFEDLLKSYLKEAQE